MIFEALILMELSILVGGAIALRAGIYGLITLFSIGLIPIALWGGKPGLIVFVIGVLILIGMFVKKVKNKPVSGLYGIHDKKSRQSIDQSSLSDIGQALSQGLHEKYPNQYPPVEN